MDQLLRIKSFRCFCILNLKRNYYSFFESYKNFINAPSSASYSGFPASQTLFPHPPTYWNPNSMVTGIYKSPPMQQRTLRCVSTTITRFEAKLISNQTNPNAVYTIFITISQSPLLLCYNTGKNLCMWFCNKITWETKKPKKLMLGMQYVMLLKLGNIDRFKSANRLS